MNKVALPSDKAEKLSLLKGAYVSYDGETDKEVFDYILSRYDGVSLRSLKAYKKEHGWENPFISQAKEAAKKSRKKKDYKQVYKKRKAKRVATNPDEVIVNQQPTKKPWTVSRADPREELAREATEKVAMEDLVEQEIAKKKALALETIRETIYEYLIQGARDTEIMTWARTKHQLSVEATAGLIEQARERIRNLGFVDITYETNRARLRLEFLFKRAVADKKDYRALQILKEQMELMDIKRNAQQQTDALDRLLGSLDDEQIADVIEGDFTVLNNRPATRQTPGATRSA